VPKEKKRKGRKKKVQDDEHEENQNTTDEDGNKEQKREKSKTNKGRGKVKDTGLVTIFPSVGCLTKLLEIAADRCPRNASSSSLGATIHSGLEVVHTKTCLARTVLSW